MPHYHGPNVPFGFNARPNVYPGMPGYFNAYQARFHQSNAFLQGRAGLWGMNRPGYFGGFAPRFNQWMPAAYSRFNYPGPYAFQRRGAGAMGYGSFQRGYGHPQRFPFAPHFAQAPRTERPRFFARRARPRFVPTYEPQPITPEVTPPRAQPPTGNEPQSPPSSELHIGDGRVVPVREVTPPGVRGFTDEEMRKHFPPRVEPPLRPQPRVEPREERPEEEEKKKEQRDKKSDEEEKKDRDSKEKKMKDDKEQKQKEQEKKEKDDAAKKMKDDKEKKQREQHEVMQPAVRRRLVADIRRVLELRTAPSVAGLLQRNKSPMEDDALQLHMRRLQAGLPANPSSYAKAIGEILQQENANTNVFRLQNGIRFALVFRNGAFVLRVIPEDIDRIRKELAEAVRLFLSARTTEDVRASLGRNAYPSGVVLTRAWEMLEVVALLPEDERGAIAQAILKEQNAAQTLFEAANGTRYELVFGVASFRLRRLFTPDSSAEKLRVEWHKRINTFLDLRDSPEVRAALRQNTGAWSIPVLQKGAEALNKQVPNLSTPEFDTVMHRILTDLEDRTIFTFANGHSSHFFFSSGEQPHQFFFGEMNRERENLRSNGNDALRRLFELDRTADVRQALAKGGDISTMPAVQRALAELNLLVLEQSLSGSADDLQRALEPLLKRIHEEPNSFSIGREWRHVLVFRNAADDPPHFVFERQRFLSLEHYGQARIEALLKLADDPHVRAHIQNDFLPEHIPSIELALASLNDALRFSNESAAQSLLKTSNVAGRPFRSTDGNTRYILAYSAELRRFVIRGEAVPRPPNIEITFPAAPRAASAIPAAPRGPDALPAATESEQAVEKILGRYHREKHDLIAGATDALNFNAQELIKTGDMHDISARAQRLLGSSIAVFRMMRRLRRAAGVNETHREAELKSWLDLFRRLNGERHTLQDHIRERHRLLADRVRAMEKQRAAVNKHIAQLQTGGDFHANRTAALLAVREEVLAWSGIVREFRLERILPVDATEITILEGIDTDFRRSQNLIHEWNDLVNGQVTRMVYVRAVVEALRGATNLATLRGPFPPRFPSLTPSPAPAQLPEIFDRPQADGFDLSGAAEPALLSALRYFRNPAHRKTHPSEYQSVLREVAARRERRVLAAAENTDVYVLLGTGTHTRLDRGRVVGRAGNQLEVSVNGVTLRFAASACFLLSEFEQPDSFEQVPQNEWTELAFRAHQHQLRYRTLPTELYRTLFPRDVPIRQGTTGNCFLLASFHAIEHSVWRDAILQSCMWRDEARDGWWVRVPLADVNAIPVFVQAPRSTFNGPLGYRILETAYMLARYGTAADLNRIHGGTPDDALQAMFGSDNVSTVREAVLLTTFTERMQQWRKEADEAQVKGDTATAERRRKYATELDTSLRTLLDTFSPGRQMLVVGTRFSLGGDTVRVPIPDTNPQLYVYASHAYTIRAVTGPVGNRLVTLVNPHDTSGSFTVTYAQLFAIAGGISGIEFNPRRAFPPRTP